MSKKNTFGIETIFYGILILFIIPINILILLIEGIIYIIVKIFRINKFSAREIFLNKDEKELLKNIDTLDGHEFENIIAELLKINGFSEVIVTKGSGDYGADIIATLNSEKYAIQCKRYDSKVGSAPIGEVLRGQNKYVCTKGIVITNNYFTKQAIEEGKINNVLLWDRDKVIELIKNKNIKKQTKIEKIKSKFNNDNLVIFTVMLFTIIVIALFIGLIDSIINSSEQANNKSSSNLQESYVEYGLQQYTEYIKFILEKSMDNTSYYIYSTRGEGYGAGNYITFEIASKENKFIKEEVESISNKIYEECKKIHFKKSGIFGDDYINIRIIFELINSRSNECNTSKKYIYSRI